MLLELIWNDNPPVTKFIYIVVCALAVAVKLEPDLENKMYLMRGSEFEVWRYLTAVFYDGAFSVKFFMRILLK